MTKKEAARERELYARMDRAGLTPDTTDQLLRIERTLHRWAERECTGEIERDGPNADGVPYYSSPERGRHRMFRIPDRERGALRRLDRS